MTSNPDICDSKRKVPSRDVMAYVVESYMVRAETSVSLRNSTPGLHKFFRSLEAT